MDEFLNIERNMCALGRFCFVLGCFPILVWCCWEKLQESNSLQDALETETSIHVFILYYKILLKRSNDGRFSALFMLGFVIPLYYKLHKIHYWSEQICLQTNRILHFHVAKRWNLGHFKVGFLSCESVSGDNLMNGF